MLGRSPDSPGGRPAFGRGALGGKVASCAAVCPGAAFQNCHHLRGTCELRSLTSAVDAGPWVRRRFTASFASPVQARVRNELSEILATQKSAPMVASYVSSISTPSATLWEAVSHVAEKSLRSEAF